MALLAAEILDDVAEFAFERAAARRLDRAEQGAVVAIEVPARRRRARQVGLVADIFVLRFSRAQIGEQVVRDVFRLAAHENVAMIAHQVGTEARERAADDDALAAPPEFGGDRGHAPSLADLAGDQDPFGVVIEIHGFDQLVADRYGEVARREAGDSDGGQVRHHDAGLAAGAVSTSAPK